MALKAKRNFSEEELKAGVLMICDPGGFMRGVMRQRLTIPVTREDLPEAYRGKTVVTHEQRLMIYDGASYALWRWRYPKMAVGSKAILLRTSRKTGKTTILEARWAWWAVINPYGRPTDGLLQIGAAGADALGGLACFQRIGLANFGQDDRHRRSAILGQPGLHHLAQFLQRARLAMAEQDAAADRPARGHPIKQFALIGMGGIAVNLADLGAHHHIFAGNAHAFRAFQNDAAQ